MLWQLCGVDVTENSEIFYIVENFAGEHVRIVGN